MARWSALALNHGTHPWEHYSSLTAASTSTYSNDSFGRTQLSSNEMYVVAHQHLADELFLVRT
jgi:hypothetical protein